MKRQDEHLDQQLGDFAPSRYPANAIQLERQLDRYGLMLICDYPQILFENAPQWRLPGWWYRGLPQDYSGPWTPATPYRSDQPEQTGFRIPMGASPRDSPLTRLAHAYQVLDDIFTPPSEPSRTRPYSSRPGYAGTPQRAYR